MIKFFRKIRQKLVEQNRVTKYLLYAFGEIILVVIGLLLALQINNWNEQRKLANEEQKLLNALEKEATSNINYIEKIIKYNDSLLQTSDSLLKKGLSNAKEDIEISDILEAFSYYDTNIETSITDEILGTNSRSLISTDSVLIQIRKLKQRYTLMERTHFYVDEFSNVQVTNFLKTSGLGMYLFNEVGDIDENYQIDFKPNAEFFSLVSLMYGSQKRLFEVRISLKNALEETLSVLESNNPKYD
jgi:hypothetical protein